MTKFYVIKATLADPEAESFAFEAVKTMYGGKRVAAGDVVFLVDSETSGGEGLVARGVVTAVLAPPRPSGPARWTPRVNLRIRRTALARAALSRAELKAYTDWADGRPQTELNFKFYRQATDKLVGVSDATAAFLDGFF